MWKKSIVFISILSSVLSVQQEWDGQYYPPAEVAEQLGLDVTDRAEYDTTVLTTDEERTQFYNQSDDETNATTAMVDELSDMEQEDVEKDTLIPAVYAPQAKMYIKDDAALLQKPNEDKQANQEVEEPKVVNRFSLKRLSSAPSSAIYDREDHNSVYQNHDQQLTPSTKDEDEPVTEISEEITTLITTTSTAKEQKRIAADAKSLGFLIKDLYLRTPLAALVDTHPASLKQSRALWENAVSANSTLSIVLVPFNSTGE